MDRTPPRQRDLCNLIVALVEAPLIQRIIMRLVSARNLLRLLRRRGSPIVFRLSGTATQRETLQLHLDRFEGSVGIDVAGTQDALLYLMKLADRAWGLGRTGT